MAAETDGDEMSRPSGTGECGATEHRAPTPSATADVGETMDEEVVTGDHDGADSCNLLLAPWHLREWRSSSARRENDAWQNLQRYSSRPDRPCVFMWRVSLLDWAHA